MESKSYFKVLKELDRLRAQGIEDTDSRIKALKQKLWLHLEQRKKDRDKKVVPKVTAIKTLQVSSSEKELGNTQDSDDEKNNPPRLPKYVYLGVAAAIVAIVYKFFNKED